MHDVLAVGTLTSVKFSFKVLNIITCGQKAKLNKFF